MSIKNGKVAFAWVQFIIDFKSREDAQRYIDQNQGKQWHFELNSVIHDEYTCTLKVMKPYRNMNRGW